MGFPSFRLEALTAANGITHNAAHDAMSDVYATISLAKLIKEKQPKLYEYVFSHRSKQQIAPLLDIHSMKPVFHVSSRYPATKGCCALVSPVAAHPTNRNGVIVYDLRDDPTALQHLSVQDIRDRLFTAVSELPAGVDRISLKMVHTNKCPVVAPSAMLRTLSNEQLGKLQLNGNRLRNNLKTLRAVAGLKEKVAEVFADSTFEIPSDPDLMIYSGGFFSSRDKAVMARVRKASAIELAEETFIFEDSRLQEMLFRYKARNYRESLNGEEQERWDQFRYQRLMDGTLCSTTFPQYFEMLEGLENDTNTPPGHLAILRDLKYYGESIIPYL